MIAQTRQAFGASSICAKHSCPQPALSGQREHSLSLSSSFPTVALKAAFPAATRTAAGLCVSGHETSLSPRDFRYVRRARRRPTITKPAAAITKVIRMYFMGRSFPAPLPERSMPKPETAPFQRPKRIRLHVKDCLPNSGRGVLFLGRFHAVKTTSSAPHLAVTGLTVLRDASYSTTRAFPAICLKKWRSAAGWLPRRTLHPHFDLILRERPRCATPSHPDV